MTGKKLLWQGDGFLEKIENIVTKLAGIGIVVLLIYAYLLL